MAKEKKDQPDGFSEYYRTHRPSKLEDVVGQEEVVQTLQKLVEKNKVPQVSLFTGDSGVGKTTIARILRDLLGCTQLNYEEINCASRGGIDTMRDIEARMQLMPMGGKSRIWFLDEFQRATQDAQSSLLKMLEDTPRKVYFILASSDPKKILSAIKTRCTTFQLKPITPESLKTIVRSVAKKEGIKLSEGVLEAITETSEGSARQALVLLKRVSEVETEKDQLEAVEKGEAKKQAIELMRTLLDRRNKWPDVLKILKNMEDVDPEALRRQILGYAAACMLNGRDPGQCNLVICAFEMNFYDSGKAGLLRACYDVFGQRK